MERAARDFHIDHLCQPVAGEDGAFAGRRASNRDITDRKAAEEQAERHLGELEAIYANAPVGLAVLDADLRYLRINERLAAMNGHPVAEHLGRSFPELVPELAAHYAPRLRQAIQTGESVVGEEVCGTTPAQPGVERVWLVSWTPVPTAGRTLAINLVVEEVTERRRVEEALRESEERFRTVAELVPDVLFATDAGGGTDYANPRFYEHTGFAPGQARGLGWLEALHPDDRERVARVWQDAVAAGQPASFRYRLRGRDGDYRWFQTRAYPLRDSTGSIVRWFGVASDIHPLIAAQESLEEADRRKDEFLAILGHELRNPMAPIRNAVEVIRMVGTNEPQLRWAAEVLDQQTAQMARLLDDLLDLPRITRGTLKLEQRPVEIGEVVQQSVDSVRPLVQERGHALTLDLPSGELWVRGDAARLLQVFVNLLSNAAKYTDPAGKIRLEVAADDVNVQVTVRDAGRGLSPQMAQRMFEPFARGDEEGGRAAGGLGLGLTIARRLVDLHGGRIEVESAGPGLGSTFTVHLPRLDAAAAKARAAPPETATRGAHRPHRILVVDDNPVVARALGILLRLMGQDVEIAHSGEDALGAAHRFRPRIALLDIGMRGMDGFELARRLRAEVPQREDLLLVAVTGYGDPAMREQSRNAGFDHHLVKPVDRRTLIQLLAEVDRDDRAPPVG
jgi:two-component system, chemotaxis family, CheB/CheR fusion protein